MTATIDKAWRTATKRSKLSKPARRLDDNHLLEGDVLDYGCGRGDDADHLGCERYDPHFAPDIPPGPFDTIMCNYVLNVIEDGDKRRDVLIIIAALLEDDGCAYITVRANRKDLKGRTSIGTWQGLINLDLPIVFKDSDSITYKFCRDDVMCGMTAEIFPESA